MEYIGAPLCMECSQVSTCDISIYMWIDIDNTITQFEKKNEKICHHIGQRLASGEKKIESNFINISHENVISMINKLGWSFHSTIFLICFQETMTTQTYPKYFGIL